jgi:hypothetical protein
MSWQLACFLSAKVTLCGPHAASMFHLKYCRLNSTGTTSSTVFGTVFDL